MDAPQAKRKFDVNCPACGKDVPRRQITVRSDRRRWLFHGAAVVAMVLLWWLLSVIGVPGEVMQYGMFLVNLPSVALILVAESLPRLRIVDCPSCGVETKTAVSRAKSWWKGILRRGRGEEPPAREAPADVASAPAPADDPGREG